MSVNSLLVHKVAKYDGVQNYWNYTVSLGFKVEISLPERKVKFETEILIRFGKTF